METKEEKKKAIQDLRDQQLELLKEASKIGRLKPPKRSSTSMKRIGKIISIGLQIQSIEIQKRIIASQPIHNFKSGGMAIVGERKEEEIILTPKGKIIDERKDIKFDIPINK